MGVYVKVTFVLEVAEGSWAESTMQCVKTKEAGPQGKMFCDKKFKVTTYSFFRELFLSLAVWDTTNLLKQYNLRCIFLPIFSIRNIC